MTNPTSNYVFLPWVRQGAAAAIQTPDTLNANQAGVVQLPVKLQLNSIEDIEQPVRLYGPGDVTGIDVQQVVRTEPRQLTTDFEPNYFPAIEFDRPDFPWLFTPAKPDGANRLRPWLCLVVVRKQAGVALRTDGNRPLPVLAIEAPARPGVELPALSESWAWAHAQVMGSPRHAGALQAALKGDPALTVSRLLCPRRLAPATAYLACVVPAFELGRKAGLGEPITPTDEQKLEPAWTSGALSPAAVTLPVYFHWEFCTGTGGDFEALVRRLEPRDAGNMPPQTGKRLMDIAQPGFKTTQPLPTDTTLQFEGALRLAGAVAGDWPQPSRTLFQGALKTILDAPWGALTKGTEPLLAPPIYGCWQAARHTVNTSPVPPAAPVWLDELNLDPRHRAVAALGTRVVQTQQEQLMASAWEQLGEIERVNQVRRQAQFGRAVNAVYRDKHFARFSRETLLNVVAPARSRLVVAATDSSFTTRALLSHRISQSGLPDRTVSAPLRRLTSPRGVISARFLAPGAPPMAIVARLSALAPAVAALANDSERLTIDQISDAQTGPVATALKQTVRFERIAAALDTAPGLGDFRIAAEGITPQRSLLAFTPPASSDSADAQAFRVAATAHQAALATGTLLPLLRAAPPLLDLVENTAAVLQTLAAAVLQSLDPEITITARVEAALGPSNDAGLQGDPLEPVLDAPSFPQPMYAALRDLSQEFLFPGLEQVPPNTVALLETNPKFVESFLVGLNAEMSHELLWRRFPTDQRGTCFRRFWDTSAGAEQPDIEAISTWGDTELGKNVKTGEKPVLLIRGDLLRRYPNSVIYAVRAVRNGLQLDLSLDPEHELQPLFRGTLQPDVTFLGFDLTYEDMIADPGWFFVIQQQPTEPRFGLDAPDFDQPLPSLTAPEATWNDLSWRHFADTEEQWSGLSHASAQAVLPVIGQVEWGKNSAHQAHITLQRPVRIAIHATELLLPTQ